MSTRLPPWAWAVAWILACAAGIINVVGVLSFQHQAFTHLTGTTSLLAAAITDAQWPNVWHLLAVIGSFVGGAAISGAIIKDDPLALPRRYSIALVIESLVLLGAVPLLNHHVVLGMYLACAASGLQNAMVSTYSGSILRTSHLTGMFTDLGIFVGQLFTGAQVEQRRLHVSLLVISAFLSGGIGGSLLFHALGYATLYVAAVITGSIALIYAVYRGLSSSRLPQLRDRS
ncbi:MAG TPA: YoaK family protein [Herpetosiphonaceae bacterium]